MQREKEIQRYTRREKQALIAHLTAGLGKKRGRRSSKKRDADKKDKITCKKTHFLLLILFIPDIDKI
jgi:hypothetical protein